jgi:opacity protein-like surface antigen
MKQPNQTSPGRRPARSSWLAVILSICTASPLALNAQTAVGTNTPDPAAINQLLQRMDQLEQKAKRVDELETEVKNLQSAANTAAAVKAPIIREVWPKVQFNVQGDIDFHAGNDSDVNNTFLLGDLDPLITAKLSEKGGVLGDFTIASDTESGFSFEVERLLAQYDFNDHFKVEAGRFNTDIGYYNNVYHNGSYFQTTVERPAIYLFEDGEGILPIHNVGISINGEIPSGSLNLEYVFEIANGRSYCTNLPVFQVEDNNDYKAVDVGLSTRPEWAPNWQFGGSAYHDTLTPTGVPRTDQLIFTAYVVYKTMQMEWYNEAVFMRDAPEGMGSFLTSAAYTQISRKFGKIRPYLRVQWRNSPSGDPVLQTINQNISVWGPAVGIRYDFTPMMALKVEYEHTELRDMNNWDELFLQWTFRF